MVEMAGHEDGFDLTSPAQTRSLPGLILASQSHRLRRQFGRTSSRLLYLAYFLPTSMLAAWLTLAAATTAVAALIVSVSGSASRCRQLGGPQRCADPCPRLAGMLKGYFLHTPHPRWTQRTSTWRAWPSWQG